MDPTEFLTGFAHRLFTKTAQEIQHVQTVNASIFPTIDKQTSWKYSRSKNQLRLSDGTKVHTFDLEDGFKENEAFRMTKAEDTSYFNFSNGAVRTGTAQVHKANPGMMYLTLHDGAKNTTLTLSHVSENSWRATPKMKKVAFDLGGLVNKSFSALNTASNYAADGVRSLGHSPGTAAAVGLGLGGLYDFTKRKFYNTDEENANETFGDRALRYAAPAGILGGAGMLQRNLIPDYYKYSPVYNSTNPASSQHNYVPGKGEIK